MGWFVGSVMAAFGVESLIESTVRVGSGTIRSLFRKALLGRSANYRQGPKHGSVIELKQLGES